MNTSKLTKLIKENKLTQEELATLIGVTRPTVVNLLKSGDFKVSQLQKLANSFNVSVCYFFDECDHHPSMNENGSVFMILKNENTNLRKEIAHLEEKCAMKDEIIQMLKKDKK